VSRRTGRLVIVNPNAARLRQAERRAALIDELKAVLERCDEAAPQIAETQGSAEVRPAVEAALSGGVRGVVGVGGDGTLRDIAMALAHTRVPLGVVPAGTGNQLAAVLGVALDPRRAVAALPAARPRPIDLGEVTVHLVDAAAATSIFTIGCGAGFDARLMATTPEHWKSRFGKAAYFAQGLRLAAGIGVQTYRLSIDDQHIETEASVAMIGNLGQLVPGLLGTRLPIEPDDGLLDLIVVGARHPLQGLAGLVDQVWRTSLGGGSGSASIRLRGRSIDIELERPEPIEVDGDHVGEGQRLAARILPAALEVLVPSS
jgi:diacylglycerol kinase family enzyme